MRISRWRIRKHQFNVQNKRIVLYFELAASNFTVNRTLLTAGTSLLRNAIVRECLLRCHGRTPADARYLGKWNYNGIRFLTTKVASSRNPSRNNDARNTSSEETRSSSADTGARNAAVASRRF
ncbi:hypothetical protein DBV15_05945 [Temnothorax longispinosus]|uniref:Uncharacterized protein n=1 Tax=Temnothorax longispinosus TaxID=300112 RepID=A0A4S2KJV2_9HYME|nr:hypothetical protein DBV15_05945 [Temnothorax longispinosus]